MKALHPLFIFIFCLTFTFAGSAPLLAALERPHEFYRSDELKKTTMHSSNHIQTREMGFSTDEPHFIPITRDRSVSD